MALDSLLETLPLEYRQFRESVVKLANLVVQTRLFPSSHPSSKKALSDAFMHLSAMLKNRKRVLIRLDDHSFYYLNFELDTGESDVRTLEILYNLLSNVSINEMEFTSGLTKEELGAFAGVVSGSSGRDARGVWESVSEMQHIRLRNRRGSGLVERSVSSSGASRNSRGYVGESTDGGSSAITDEISRVLGKLNKLDPSGGGSAAGRLIAIVTEDIDTPVVLLLNSLKNFDEYTFVHSINVAVISAAIAKAAGLSEDDVNRVALAGLMHDIGKLYVPKYVIHKTSRLNPMEWAFMKKHPVDGERILREEGIDPFACRVAYEHHIGFDFAGYPAVKKGYEILTASHIVRIADTYDAITTKRPYRRQLSPYEAVKFMSGFAGSEFHPGLFEIFMRMLGNIPVGTLVKLNTGEEAVVVNVGKDPNGEVAPTVRIIRDQDGNPPEHELIFDLAKSDGGDGRKIVAVIDKPVRDVDVGLYIG